MKRGLAVSYATRAAVSQLNEKLRLSPFLIAEAAILVELSASLIPDSVAGPRKARWACA